MDALYGNTAGSENTAIGLLALAFNTTGSHNTASGAWAPSANSTGVSNTAVGRAAGSNATTGSYNMFLGAEVGGTAADTNTIRIGLPYDSATGAGQNQTFIAGIHATQLMGSAVQVFIDANGQLGTLSPPIASGSGTTPLPLALQQQVHEQRAINAAQQATIGELQTANADLRARVARVEALLTARGDHK